MPDDVCKSKEELEEINGENLRETTSILDPKRVLREDKGRESENQKSFYSPLHLSKVGGDPPHTTMFPSSFQR